MSAKKFWIIIVGIIVAAIYLMGCDGYCVAVATVSLVRVDLSGMRFGRWQVSRRIFYNHDEWYYECVCDCGTVKNISSKSLKRGTSCSCGCLRSELQSERCGTHRETNKSDEYRAWMAIKYRCLRPSSKSYSRYGGRGISVCDRWLESYENFLSDMGRRPSGDYSIERIDVNGDYEPANCRWATKKEQANNTRNNVMITYANKTLTMAQWADELGVNYKLLWWYLNEKKVSLEDFVRIKNLNYETA